jgi:hypothetical protein
MLGAAGCIAPEILGKAGIIPAETGLVRAAPEGLNKALRLLFPCMIVLPLLPLLCSLPNVGVLLETCVP